MSEFQADHSRWDKLGLDMTVSNGVYGHAVQALSSLDVIEQNPKWQTDFSLSGVFVLQSCLRGVFLLRLDRLVLK